MKRILLSVLIFNTLNIQGFAQSKAETAVANAVETLRKAMVEANKTILETLTADELSYGHSSGKVETKAEFVDALASGKSDFVKMELHDQTIKIVDKTAIVRHRLLGEINDGGKPGTVNLNILLIWQKQKGGWKLLARQAARVL